MNDLISRQDAIDALEKMSANYGAEGRREWHPHIEECKSELRMLPSAQPELIAQDAYVRGFEQGRTQGMIDAQGEPMSRLIDNTIKAEWTNADVLDLQPTCNQLATDVISRQAALNALAQDEAYDEDIPNRADGVRDAIITVTNLPSAQLDDWMERNKERILQAGMEGREIEFRIGGRLFAIREKAQ